jgi:hypothetical protein
MTLKQLIQEHPQIQGESQRAYARRLAAFGVGTYNSLRCAIQSEMVTVKQTLKGGEIVGEVQKLVTASIDIPENFAIKRISTNINSQQQWVIAEPEKNRELTIEEIKEALKDLDLSCLNKTPIVLKPIKSDYVLRVIVTDIHVGMETNQDGNGLYGEVWNEAVLMQRLETIVQKISQFTNCKLYKEIHLINLGDFMDGWDGQTVRKGHNLPQNMCNKKAFMVGIKFLIALYKEVSKFGSKVVFHSITNSNHSNDFDYIVNHAAKEILKAKYGKIQYNIYQRFIGHYIIGKHCFILCHGKDAKNLKFGFKPILDAKQKDKIKEYIKHHSLEKYFCTFEKGDTHLQLIDSMSMEGCDYNNYLALSPASEWVQTNFSKGRSGFNIMEVNLKENEKGLTTFYFDWQKPKDYDYGI